MPKFYLFIVLFLGASISTYAMANSEKGVSGIVLDGKSRKPIPGVICKLYGSQETMIGYFITDNKGEYHLKSYKEAVDVSFSHLGYKKVKISVEKLLNNDPILLWCSSQKIKEVTVHVPPLKWTKDTLRYNVGSFVEKKDRAIGDVLKKLPGIEVDKNGTIKYQGESISRFYIEGKDLLGGAYNQATNSLPVDAVAQIQVLEHHQHVKALKNSTPPSEAAINLTIKKGYKVRMFGEVETGVGCSPLLLDNKLFLVKIKGKDQTLITARMNNVGKDLSNDTKEKIDWDNIDMFEPLPHDLFLSKSLSSLPLPLQRYLDNRSVTGGANKLVGLNDHSDLRVNVTYYGDKREQSLFSLQRLGKQNPIVLTERSETNIRTQYVVPQIQYENNNDRFYLKNNLKASFSSSKQKQDIINNGQPRNQDNRQSPFFIEDHLDWTVNNGTWVYSLNSLVRYFNSETSMWVKETKSSNSNYLLEQHAKQKQLLAKGSMCFTNIVQQQERSLSFKYLFKQDHIDLDGDPVERNEYLYFKDQGEQKRWKYALGVTPSYIWHFRHGRMTLMIPMSAERMGARWESNDISRNYLSYRPSINFFKQYRDLWEWRLSGYYHSNASHDFVISNIPYFQDYRSWYYSTMTPEQLFDRTNILGGQIKVDYHDLASLFFAGIKVHYAETKNHQYLDYDYSSEITKILPTWGDNTSRIFYLNGVVDKSFLGTGLTLKIKGDYNRHRFLFSQNGTQYYNRSEICTGSLGLVYKKLSWFSANMKITTNYSWQKSHQKRSDILRNSFYHLDLSFYPIKRIDFTVSSEYNQREIVQDRFKDCMFLDLQAHYAPTKRVDLFFYVTNLLNQNIYEVASEHGVNYNYRRIPLRHQSFIFSLAYKL